MSTSSLYALANVCAAAAEEAAARGVTGQSAVWGTREEWRAREAVCRDAMHALRQVAAPPASPSAESEVRP